LATEADPWGWSWRAKPVEKKVTGEIIERAFQTGYRQELEAKKAKIII